MEAWLIAVKSNFVKKGRKGAAWTTDDMMKILHHAGALTKPFEYLLATGNLSSKTGMVRKVKNFYETINQTNKNE